MTSVINFRFKNALQQDSVTFDGSVIQVGDIKRLIAVRRGLGVEGAQELTLYDSTTSEELGDDSKLIPRSSLVLVKRAPVTRFKPLTATSTAHPTSQAPSSAAAGPVSVPDNRQDDFGGGLYSLTPPMASGEEEALGSLLAGQAATWQREVRQAVIRGRGRGRGGRGGPPLDYRCPRCEATGAHWLQDCPTHGDPAYDRKRIRPPIGIPLTRLGQTDEGGLVLPDGTTGTLVPNEDAFAQEVLGLPTVPDVVQEQQQSLLIEGGNQPPPSGTVPELPNLLALPAPPTSKPPPPPGSPPAPSTNGTSFFDDFMAGATAPLPHGPPAFLQQAFDRPSPLLRRDFERMQDDFRRQAGLPPLWRQRAQRATRRSQSPVRRRSRSPSRREGPPTWRQERFPPRRIWKPRSKDDDDTYGRRRRSRSREDIRERGRNKSRERERERSNSREREQGRSPSPERDRRQSKSPERERRQSKSPKTERRQSKSPKTERRQSKSQEREQERSSSRRVRQPSRSPVASPSAQKLRAKEHENGKDDHRSRRGARPSRERSERKEDEVDRWEQRSPSYSPPPRVRDERVKPRALEAASRKKSDNNDGAERADSGKRSRTPGREEEGIESKRDRRRIMYKTASPERSPSARHEHRHHKKEKKERKEKHRSRDREKKSSRHRH